MSYKITKVIDTEEQRYLMFENQNGSKLYHYTSDPFEGKLKKTQQKRKTKGLKHCTYLFMLIKI